MSLNMDSFDPGFYLSTKVWCEAVNADDTEHMVTTKDLEDIAPVIMLKVLSQIARVDYESWEDRSNLVRVAWVAGMYCQAKDPDLMKELNEHAWIVEAYPDDIRRNYHLNLSEIKGEAVDYLVKGFSEDPVFRDESHVAADQFLRIVSYYEAVSTCYRTYKEALEPV